MSPPLRILIVEDEEILAGNLKIYLGRRTPDVRIAHDAESAMEMLKTFTPDLIVLDYVLPGIDGIRAHREFFSTSRWQPRCIMISGFMTDLMAEDARRQGIQHLLCKPFSFAELQHEIDLSTADNIGAFTDGNRRVDECRTHQQIS